MLQQIRKIDNGKLFLAISAAIFVLVAIFVVGMVLKPKNVESASGLWNPRDAYIAGNSTVPVGNSTTLDTASTSPVTLKSATVEAATTTTVFSMLNSDGFDITYQYFATNTPMGLSLSIEYSDDVSQKCAEDTRPTTSLCTWSTDLRDTNTAGVASATTSPTRVFPYITNRELVVRNATTTETIRGPRDVIHRWARVGAKVSDGPTIRFWAHIIIREASR